MNWRGARGAEGQRAAGERWWSQMVAPVVLLAAVCGLPLLAGLYPRLVERYYSRSLYPHVERWVGWAASLSRFSLAEVLLVALVASSAGWLAWSARQFYLRRRSGRRLLLSSLTTLMWLAGLAAALFMLLFGLNYQRQPLVESLQLEQRDPSPPEMEVIGRSIVEGINRSYTESGVSSEAERGSLLPLTPSELYAVLEAAYESEPLLREVSGGGGLGGRAAPKPVFFSGLMSRFGISGIYSPFTGEPNYNAIQPDCSLPFAVAHEMAHQRGFARESEANFVAFLVCIRASHPYVRYSGYLSALRVLGVLFRLAPERYREMVRMLGEGPRADLKARAAFWGRYLGRLSSVSNQLNHVYLKVNGIKSGVRNYNEDVSLIIGFYLKQSAMVAPPLAD